MFCCAFNGESHVLNPSMDDVDVLPASVLIANDVDGKSQVVTCWKCTQEELNEINRTGRVWLVVRGETMPPSLVMGIRPFEYGD